MMPLGRVGLALVMDADFSRIANAPVSANQLDLAELAQFLERVNFSLEGVEDLLGSGPFEAFTRDHVVPARYRVGQVLEGQEGLERQLALVVGLFLLGDSFAVEELSASLGAEVLELLGRLNLVSQREGYLEAAVELRPHAADDGVELWVASDLGAHQRPGVLRRDHVLGIGRASLTLAQLTERTRVARALDLGTGCGVQTFHLLAHVDHVVATDISERALAFTRFNLLLNAGALGLDPAALEERVSLRLGSLLEPVEGELFDLVVSNPPFVITPRVEKESVEDQFVYRDGGLAGDGIVSTLVRELPGVLVPGGRVQMLGNWEIPEAVGDEEVDWSVRPRSWVGEQTEAWFIQREVLSTEQYAETWLRDASENRDPAAFEERYVGYIRDFSSRRVGAVGFGMIWLRRPEVGRVPEHFLQRFEEISYPIQQPIAPFMVEAVELFDRAVALDDAALAACHLVVAEDVTEERHARPGAEHPGVILLREGAGLRRTVLESSETAAFVSVCDGELAVGQIINALTSLYGWEEDRAEQQGRLLHDVRNLIVDGFLRFDVEG